MAQAKTAEQKADESAAKSREAQTEAQEARDEAALAIAKVEGEEAMRIARINHPNTDWVADPITGAPLVPGSAEVAEDMVPTEPAEEGSEADEEINLQAGRGSKRVGAEAPETKDDKSEK